MQMTGTPSIIPLTPQALTKRFCVYSKISMFIIIKLSKRIGKMSFQQFDWDFMHVAKPFTDEWLYWLVSIDSLTCSISVFLRTEMLQNAPQQPENDVIAAIVPPLDLLSLQNAHSWADVPTMWACLGSWLFLQIGVWTVCVCLEVGVYITGLNLNAGHDAVCTFWFGCSALLWAEDPSDTASILSGSNGVLGPTRIEDT